MRTECEFDVSLPPRLKALLMAAVFVVDVAFFQVHPR
jgi:hypothetical protein